MKDSIAPITVVVPCLNAERTLAEALKSVLIQTAQPMEVLVIDDGSTDRSVAIAAAFDPRVRVLRNIKGNTGGARSLGTTEARGTYVTFCDSDDIIEPTKLEKQLAVLEESDPYTLTHTGARIFWDDGSRPDHLLTRGEQAVGRCTQVVFERNPVCGASVMMRRSVILELGNYDPDLCGTDDFGLSLVASTRCDFVYLPEPLYRMRRHDNNMTRRKARMAYYHWLAQKRFQRRCPEAFGQLPPESVEQYMIDPVLRTVREAYWRRESADYARLLRLAVSLAPDDPDMRKLWRRRWCPMSALRAWDRMTTSTQATAPEVPG